MGRDCYGPRCPGILLSNHHMNLNLNSLLVKHQNEMKSFTRCHKIWGGFVYRNGPEWTELPEWSVKGSVLNVDFSACNAFYMHIIMAYRSHRK